MDGDFRSRPSSTGQGRVPVGSGLTLEIARSEAGALSVLPPVPYAGCLRVAPSSWSEVRLADRAGRKKNGVEDVKLFDAAARLIAFVPYRDRPLSLAEPARIPQTSS